MLISHLATACAFTAFGLLSSVGWRYSEDRKVATKRVPSGFVVIGMWLLTAAALALKTSLPQLEFYGRVATDFGLGTFAFGLGVFLLELFHPSSMQPAQNED